MTYRYEISQRFLTADNNFLFGVCLTFIPSNNILRNMSPKIIFLNIRYRSISHSEIYFFCIHNIRSLHDVLSAVYVDLNVTSYLEDFFGVLYYFLYPEIRGRYMWAQKIDTEMHMLRYDKKSRWFRLVRVQHSIWAI
jgi:hypothetical protein